MHVLPAKHSYAWLPRKCDYRTDTDRRTDRQTPDKVIPMCRYDSQATQKMYFLMTNPCTNVPSFLVNISIHVRKVWITNFEQRAATLLKVDKMLKECNTICFTSRQSDALKFKSIYQRRTEDINRVVLTGQIPLSMILTDLCVLFFLIWQQISKQHTFWLTACIHLLLISIKSNRNPALLKIQELLNYLMSFDFLIHHQIQLTIAKPKV